MASPLVGFLVGLGCSPLWTSRSGEGAGGSLCPDAIAGPIPILLGPNCSWARVYLPTKVFLIGVTRDTREQDGTKVESVGAQ